MHELLQNLLDAHVHFEVARFSGKGLKKQVDQEVSSAFEWMRRIKFAQIASEEHVLGVIDRNVVKLPIAGGITELVGEMSKKVQTSPANATTTLEDIFPKKLFYALVDKVDEIEKANRQRVHRALYTQAYFSLTSNILVAAVREYLLSENSLIRQMPGLKFLLDTGREAAGKAMPAWLTDLERRLRAVLQEKVDAMVRGDEEFFEDLVSSGRLVELSEEVWQEISKVTLDNHFSALNTDDMEDFIVWGYEFWLNFRTTPYFTRIYTELVRHFFDKYGDRDVEVLLDDMGITQEMVAQEIYEALKPIVKKALSSGYLEKRIRERLQAFYASPQAGELLKAP